MNTAANNAFKSLIQRIFELPLWIKQIIYFELNEEFKSSSISNGLVSCKKEELLQIYVPKITFLGKKELESRVKDLDPNIYKFLEGVLQNLNIIEMAVNNGWSLAECSTYFVNALNAEFLVSPESPCIKGTALYMSGIIRLGEYFVKLGKISIEQLDEALRTQRYIEESVGDRTALGEILINLGFITKADTEGILLLKEESKKRYIPELNPHIRIPAPTSNNSPSNGSDPPKADEQIAKLIRENNQLKDQLRKILRIGG